MGTALGYAMTQPALVALSVFAALGLGMAAPFLVLSLSPGLIRLLPKPGAWMDAFKQFLAFPLYAAAVWLLWVLGKQSGVNAMAAISGGCVLVALAMWMWERGRLSSRALPLRLAGAAVLLLALTVLRSPLLEAQRPSAAASADWERYSPSLLAELRAAGKPVFVNVTADWCITCLANEKVALSNDAVRADFERRGITYLKGDWTNSDPVLTRLLAEHGRNGVPLYLLYAGSRQDPPLILPQLLTPSIVLDTLAEAFDGA
jgi:thiol:disulfide interchange protein DsbD